MADGAEVGRWGREVRIYFLGLVSAIVGDIYRIISAVLLLRPKD